MSASTSAPTRRATLLATLLAGLGLATLCAGLAWLLTIFAAERARALDHSARRAETLARFAHLSLSQAVLDRLRAAVPWIDAAEADPLLPAAHLARVRDGAPVVPPPPPTGPERHLAAHYAELQRPTPRPDLGPEADEAVTAREALRADLFAHLAAHDDPAAAEAFRALLSHRTRFVLPAHLDVPLALAAVEGLAADGRFDGETLARVLHAGVEDRHGRRLEGLQRLLLRRQAAFSPTDFAFLVARMAAVSQQVGAPVDAFLARTAPPGAAVGAASPTVYAPPLHPTEAALAGPGWASHPTAAGAVDGLRLDAHALLAAVAEQLTAGDLLQPGEHLSLPDLGAAAQPLAALAVTCDGPAFAAARAEAHAAFRWKTGLLALTAAFALLATLLGLGAGRRRQRYLDLKTEFVATVSHELRTPLAAVRALAETLERRLGGEPRARDYPRRIVRAIDGLGGLVENILSFNRLEQDRVRPRRERVDLDALLAAVAAEVAEQAPRPATWQVQGPTGLALDADPALLHLVISNLCRNGWKYNDRDPIALRVEVAVVPPAGRGTRRADRAGLQLRVCDNGQGVDAAAAPHLFTAFYRAPGTSSRRGSGLGLALCRRAIAAHGGAVRLAETSGEGSVFAVDLPGCVLPAGSASEGQA